jgi:hypothetical protein
MEAAILIAQSAAEATDVHPVVHLVLTWVPFTVLVLALGAVGYVMLRAAGRQMSELHKRSLQHMDRLEAKNDEMIGLLKEIRDKP